MTVDRAVIALAMRTTVLLVLASLAILVLFPAAIAAQSGFAV